MDPSSKYDADCSALDIRTGVCMGGAARIAAVVEQERSQVGSEGLLVLDAGDEFMGTVMDSYYKGNESLLFMGHVGIDAFVLGAWPRVPAFKGPSAIPISRPGRSLVPQLGPLRRSFAGLPDLALTPLKPAPQETTSSTTALNTYPNGFDAPRPCSRS